MKINCVSASQIPSDTANSIQVMKVCQAFTQIGHDVTLVVPGKGQSTISNPQLQNHYGLHKFFDIEWLPVHNRRLFPWKARSAGEKKTNVIFTGFVPNEQIHLYQPAADVLLLLPSCGR
jgi:hypothetical protein